MNSSVPLPPSWATHFLVHVVKRCCSLVLKYIKVLEKNKNSDIPPWALHFFVNVVKSCCAITIRYVEDVQEVAQQQDKVWY